MIVLYIVASMRHGKASQALPALCETGISVRFSDFVIFALTFLPGKHPANPIQNQSTC